MKEVRFRVWGTHPLEEAASSSQAFLHKVVYEKTKAKYIKRLSFKRQPKECFETDKAGLDRFTEGTRHQGVAGEVSLQCFEGIEDFLEKGETLSGWIMGTDQIQDPQNLGSLCRSAHFFGASALMVTLDRSSGLNGTVAKASAGALFSLPVILARNLAREIEGMKERQIWVLGLDADADTVLGQGIDLKGPLAVLVGSEGDGLRELTKKRVDQLVRLDFPGQRDSLNAAIAAGITAYEVARKRRP